MARSSTMMRLLCCSVVLSLVMLSLAAEPKGAPLPPLPTFGCRPYEILPDEKTPTDVNKLRPHDIKAVIAFGDSMTAAFGAKAGKFLSGEPYVPREDRYTSFSGGGGSLQLTLPNMIGVYNRNVQGGAIGPVLPLDDLEEKGHHHEPFFNNLIRLNSALSGGRVQDVPDMINYVVKELKTTYNATIDFNNDWKLATLLIGANNLCGACRNDSGDDPDSYETELNNVIQMMYEQIPRVRLNLLPMFNIGQVRAWAMSDTYCKRMWETIAESECGCVTGRSVTPEDIDVIAQTAAAYRDRSAKVAQQWASKNLSNFTVAYQPFTGDVKITNGALTSDFDCFHPSWITHAWLGVGLWNSMMLPPAQKPTNATYYLLNGMDIICPSKDQYLQ